MAELSGAQRRKRSKDLGLWTEADQQQRREETRKRRSRRYKQQREIVDAYKISKGCADCGYNTHPAALDFDHLPGSSKFATIAGMVCSNCHRIRTVERNKERRLLSG
jgi:hypothetical protein